MKDAGKTKAQLIDELAALRQRVSELEDRCPGRPSASPVQPDRDADPAAANHRLRREIAERRRAVEAMRQSEERYRTLVQTIRLGVQEVDSLGLIQFANRPYYEMMGCEDGELLGEPIFDRLARDEERDTLREYLATLVKEQPPPTPYLTKKRTKDGRVIDIRVDWNYKRDAQGKVTGFISVISDVTEGTRAEKALRVSEERYRAVVEDQTELICRWRPGGIHTFVNGAYCRCFGKSKEELLGQNLMDLIPPEHHDQAWRHFESLTARDPVATHEHEVMAAGGKVRWHQWTDRAIVDASGEIVEYQSVGRDITERKWAEQELRKAHAELERRVRDRTAELATANRRLHQEIAERRQTEEALREREETLRDLFENTNDLIVSVSPAGRLLYANRAWRERMGYTEEETTELSLFDTVHPDSREHCVQAFQTVLEGGAVTNTEAVFVAKDGRSIMVEGNCNRRCRNGEPVAVWGIFRDVTERRQAEEALRDSERLLRQVIDASPSCIFVKDQDGRFLLANKRMAESHGTTPEAMIGETDFAFVGSTIATAQEVEKFLADDREVIAKRQPKVSSDESFTLPDGAVRWHQTTKIPLSVRGNPNCVLGVAVDITDRKVAEQALRHRIEFEKLITATSTRFINLPSDATDQGVEEALREIGAFAGVDRSYAFLYSDDGTRMSNTHEWCAAGIDPARNRLQKLPVDAFRWFNSFIRRREVVYVPRVADLPAAAQAEKREWQAEAIQSLVCAPMVCAGSLIGFVGFDSVRREKTWPDELVALLRIFGEILANAIERKRSEEALRESQRAMSTLMSNLPGMVYRCLNDRDWTMEFVSEGCTELTGFQPNDLVRSHKVSYAELIVPEDREPVWTAVQAAVKVQQPFRLNYRIKTASGAERWVWEQGRGVFGPDGELLALEGFITDVSDRVEAEEALRRADRLASVGTVIAGVAHELNNPLTSISGLAELLAKNRSLERSGKKLANEIMEQAVRCSRIVEDLLGFARARSVAMRPVQVNEVVKRCLDLARQARRFDHMEIVERYASGMPVLMADPQRLEQVFINIIRNASDALRDARSNRRLTVETSHSAGLIQVAFTDAGPGIADPSRVFDPFYSTKPTGEGTGLGLSVSHGIIKDHGGSITAENVAIGARFCVNLPVRPPSSGHR